MKKIMGRILAILPAVALQILWYIMIFRWLENFENLFQSILSVLSVILVLYLVSERAEASYRILWLIAILALPILGTVLFLFLGHQNTGKRLKRKLKNVDEKLPIAIKQDENVLQEVAARDKRLAQSLEQITLVTGFPIYKNRESDYYPVGEDCFQVMCEELEKAQKYIYVEYFIIQNGVFWNTLVEIMARKASEGVDVRVIYDDLGSIATFSALDVKALYQKKIKCIPFNPFFLIKTQLNNRDHRKIMVIDGKVAFSGGINLSDEYVNITHPFGHWKDLGFRITGEAVKSYTYMFLQFWNAFSIDKISAKQIALADNGVWEEKKTSLQEEKQDSGQMITENQMQDGYVLPYYDSPVRKEDVSNTFFTEMLSVATEYVYFYTPYLMLGDTLLDAFIRCAKRGVDVRIILPGIPDKKLVYRISRSYYYSLLKAGVKIYEYTPGFVHAKGCIVDDKVAVIGTVNLDYRSLFLHFECSSIFYHSHMVSDMKTDFLKTQEKCEERTFEKQKKGFFNLLMDGMLHLVAPLL